jgi:aminodeoxyfutalosine synthase
VEPILSGTGLEEIYEKVSAGERLSADDGIRLFDSRHLTAVGYLANMVRERINGSRAYYIYNQHINYSNICKNACRFCAFRRDEGESGGYRMTVNEVVGKVRERIDEPIRELHIVGGCDPDIPFDYYIDMLHAVRQARPDVHIQAFTCVEIAHIADVARLTVKETLIALREAGLGSIPGGGAEVFAARIRQELCESKLSPKGWLDVAETAHELGIRSNATMLYGHVESTAERVEHLVRLRESQDRTGGFLAFIPLSFHPANTGLADLKGPTGMDDLKNIAVARLMLDNFPHIKAFWIMIGAKLAQISLSFGADDMDGTVIEEKITHMAGADTAELFPVNELRRYIIEAGREPVERDTLYNVIHREDI